MAGCVFKETAPAPASDNREDGIIGYDVSYGLGRSIPGPQKPGYPLKKTGLKKPRKYVERSNNP